MNKEMIKQIEKYSLFELKLQDLEETDLVAACAVFQNENEKAQVSAFRNRRNEYIVRFMPDREGTWNYHTLLPEMKYKGHLNVWRTRGKIMDGSLRTGIIFNMKMEKSLFLLEQLPMHGSIRQQNFAGRQ